MKKNIIIAFSLIFILFTIGSGVTIYNLLTTTSNLSYIINLHEIEDIRKELSFSIQKIQTYAYASPDIFAQHLDKVTSTAIIIDETIMKCHDCHHVPAVQAELNATEELIHSFQTRLDELINSVTSGVDSTSIRSEVLLLSDTILHNVQGMVTRAASTINQRTTAAMKEIDHSYLILSFTLGFTFLAALFIAQLLTKRITRPIDDLLTATHKIKEGEFGYKTDRQEIKEFEVLFNTFNEMSSSLAGKEKKINNNLLRLNQLNTVTLPLHASQDKSATQDYLRSCINVLIDVEQNGIMLPVDGQEKFILTLSTPSENNENGTVRIEYGRDTVLEAFKAWEGRPIVQNTEDYHWPFGEKPAQLLNRNLLLHWLINKGDLIGALIATNKEDGDFSEEDQKILGILANNISVALENRKLYNDLQKQMDQLTKTQRQLVEAEKLNALGTLAGGVAHDFNNILCGMIGHVALLKRNRSKDDRDYKMLETVEKAGFRAANLTKQLLAFSRQGITETKPINVNDSVNNVISILKNTIPKLITISLNLADPLPLIDGDPAQMEQVVMNLCVNARDAMPEGGELSVETSEIILGKKESAMFSDVQPGRYVRLAVSDIGTGIDKKHLSRIFEPFFTTKEFGKGTGLGLSMVYGIVKSHRGFCDVQSAPGKGSRFTVYLPVSDELTQEEQVEDEISRSGEGTILIVDDEELIASMLAEHLEDLGYITFHAKNGEEAVSILKEQIDKIDLVILDINMPVMDGKAAYTLLKETKPDVKVLVASGYALDGTAREIVDSGAQGFIQKPYSLTNISIKISQVLSVS
jgi:signal transduction histidine kinase/CheY-like chemotaxis protein/HAMP domain-containing protein